MLKPKKIFPGDNAAVISPCYGIHVSEKDSISAAMNFCGLNAVFEEHTFDMSCGYCAKATDRAADFNKAIYDNSIKLIIFDGGEVGNEILPYLDYEAIKRTPKIICSYSDATGILNVISSKTGVVTYYGQSWRSPVSSEYNRQCFIDAFFSSEIPKYRTNGNIETITPGKASGKLIGGYLLNFSLLMGNPYFTYDKSEKHILFLEENIAFNSPPAVSRYLSNIEQNDFFKTVCGIIIGNYSEKYSPDFMRVIKRFADKRCIPFIKCDDFGHGKNQAILPIGIKASIDAGNKKIQFRESFTL